MSALLEIEDLAVDFGTRVAVDGLDLVLAHGEVLAVVGESGSGKSVTALTALGLVERHLGGTVRHGSVRFEGRDLLELDERSWTEVRGRRIAMVFQDPTSALNPVHRVGAQIAEQMRAHGHGRREARRRAVELLEIVGIAGAERRARWYPHEFSGGMRQRVAIAMALSCSPDVLIADEPTTSLDATVQAQILQLLRDLKAERGLSVLLITHDMGVVASVADRVAVMYGGRVVETGPTGRVLAHPLHPYTAGLIASVPSLRTDEPPQPIQGEPGAVSTQRRGCLFAPRCALYEAGACDREQARVASEHGHNAACWRAAVPSGAGEAVS